MKTFGIFLFLLLTVNGFAQSGQKLLSELQGTWLGNFENHSIQMEISKSPAQTYQFIFTNYLHEQFIIDELEVKKPEKSEIVATIKEAKFSSERYKKCIYSEGELVISEITSDQLLLNLNSVGPDCWISFDVVMNMGDLNGVLLKKVKNTK